MRTNFLDYYKLILDKVSFQQELFRKEYRKAMDRLTESEQHELNNWLNERGFHLHDLQKTRQAEDAIGKVNYNNLVQIFKV